ncbi:hypothetical protein BT93_C1854 [Corymbia citriodora subsp. variegata]|nr:hypothetical protein BT93_C1854 [Corymbia citriodora subsp. variegata]
MQHKNLWLLHESFSILAPASTRGKGYNLDQFPEGGYFIAASDGLWDNGAACGRRYCVRCISGPKRPCKEGTIFIEVSFNAISRYPKAKINVEYTQ